MSGARQLSMANSCCDLEGSGLLGWAALYISIIRGCLPETSLKLMGVLMGRPAWRNDNKKTWTGKRRRRLRNYD